MAEQQLIGALEAGGTKMVCATGYADGTVLEREQIATTTPQETVEAVNAWFADKGIAALGIGAFGPTAVNPASPQYGKILETPKTAWRYFDLLGTIQNELNIPCGYDTDVNVACLGEVTFGCAQGLTDVVYLTIGTGVGAGVLSGGKLVHGMMHPEAGHILVTRDPRDTIGEHSACPFHDNCLEGLIAGPGVKKRWDGKSAGDMADDPEAMDLLAGYLAQALMTYIAVLRTAEDRHRRRRGRPHPHRAARTQEVRRDAQRLHRHARGGNDIDCYIVNNSLEGKQGIMGCLALGAQALQQQTHPQGVARPGNPTYGTTPPRLI